MKEAEGGPSLKKIQVLGWMLLAVLTGGFWLGFDFFMARSVFFGGFLANISFWLLQRDLTRLLEGPLDAVKARFFVQQWGLAGK